MARNKSSVIEDLMDISAQLPWKAGVGLAVVAYVVLHYFATRVPLTTNPAELKTIGKTVGDSITHGVGTMPTPVSSSTSFRWHFWRERMSRFLAGVASQNFTARWSMTQQPTLWKK